jgi:hypothetical protein
VAKGDKWNQVLMFNCNVKLKCDDEVLELKYIPVEGKGWGTWWPALLEGVRSRPARGGLRARSARVQVPALPAVRAARAR